MLTDTLPSELTFGTWITQSGATEANDVITWQGMVETGAEVRFVFTAVLQKNTATIVIPVVNRVIFTTPSDAGSDVAVFDLYVTNTIFLPLVMRNF